MKTGIVIIHYNDFESISNLIKNILDYKVLDKIVIVDNNSKEEIRKKLRKLSSKKVEIIENNENKGFASAINIGCKKLINDLGKCNLIISNSDIIIDKEEDLIQLINHLNNKNIGVVAPTIFENKTLNRGWKNPTPFIDSLMNLVYVHRFIRKKYVFYKEEYYENKTSFVDVVSGCFFLMKSDVLDSINYFDENTFLYYEENILSKKIHDKKLKVLVDNEIIIIHNHSVSIDKNLKKINKLKLQKQSQYYFHSNYNNANLIEKILLKRTSFISRIILTIVYFIKDLIKRN